MNKIEYIKEEKNNFGKARKKNRHLSYLSDHSIGLSNNTIIDITGWNDLEMDKVFEYIDRTYSKTGEQYLYNLLHIRPSENESKILKQKVNYYANNFDNLLKNAFILKKYNRKAAYSLYNFLFAKQYFKMPKWTILLSLLALVFGILSIIFKSLFIYFVFIGVINTVLHYYFKQKINTYHSYFINIKYFHNVYLNLIKFDNESNVVSRTDKKNLQKIAKICSYLNMNIDFANELTSIVYYLFEIIKGLFLIDVILFNSTMRLINKYIYSLQNVYNYIGQIDTALSIVSLKKGTKGCEPVFTNSLSIKLKNAYHPLIEKCIPNNIECNLSNAIITGGNMSGKTTFLKTIGLNILLSQTINYSFSEEIIIPKLNIISSIKISDSIEDSKSFFMNELLRAKTILETIKSSIEPYIVFIDEIFKGTNTKDRITLASAFLRYLTKYDCLVICTTHDLKIIDFVKVKYATYYFGNSFNNGIISFDYKIHKGIQAKTNVFELVRSIDFPDEIIKDMFNLNKLLIKKAHNTQ